MTRVYTLTFPRHPNFLIPATRFFEPGPLFILRLAHFSTFVSPTVQPSSRPLFNLRLAHCSSFVSQPSWELTINSPQTILPSFVLSLLTPRLVSFSYCVLCVVLVLRLVCRSRTVCIVLVLFSRPRGTYLVPLLFVADVKRGFFFLKNPVYRLYTTFRLWQTRLVLLYMRCLNCTCV